MKTAIIMSAVLALACTGCYREKAETTTRGTLHALFAESTAPATALEVERFLSTYRKGGANITYEFVPSDDAINRMLRDTLRYIVATRPMTASEKQRLPKIEGFNLTETVIAYDGVAVIVHKKNPVEQITTGELVKVLSGEIRRWEQLSYPESMKGPIELSLQDSSDISQFIDARLLQGKMPRNDAQKTRTSLATLQDVADRTHSLGLVGILWVDSSHAAVNVLKVAETRKDQDTTFRVSPERIGRFSTPHPANIYRSYYPLKRAYYAYTFGPMGSFASGFGEFVATADGQRIFLEKGIVPGTQLIRLRSTE